MRGGINLLNVRKAVHWLLDAESMHTDAGRLIMQVGQQQHPLHAGLQQVSFDEQECIQCQDQAAP